LADELVPRGEGWAWGQAVFDLGASVCRRRIPACGGCPIRAHCAWAGAGWPAPDPVERSAGVSTAQAAFAGSDRQGRGRLVDALRAGPLAAQDVAQAMGWPDDPERATRVATRMAVEGLVVVDREGRHRLP
jgi:A/G-specific adenine glycosylase